MPGMFMGNQKTILQALSRALVREAHVLRQYPHLLWQQLYNRLQWEGEGVMAALEAAYDQRTALENPPWIKDRTPIQESEALVRTLEGHTDAVGNLVFSPDGRLLVSTSNDKSLKVWETHIWQERFTQSGLSDTPKSCIISPDGAHILLICGKTILILDAVTGAEKFRLRHQTYVNATAISPDGRYIYANGRRCTIIIWDASTGMRLAALKGHTGVVTNLAVSPDGRYLVSASSYEICLKVWEAASGELLHTLDGHQDGVFHCAVSPDGTRIVSASKDKRLKVWEASTGSALYTLRGHTQAVRKCTFSPDGCFIVSMSEDQTLRIWEADTGQERATLRGHADNIEAFTISPDGKSIITASGDRTLKVWDALTGETITTFTGHTMAVHACAVNPRGDRLVSGGSDQSIKIWDMSELRSESTHRGHTNSIAACAISPEGDFIVSASADGSLKIWDMATGQERATLEGHQGIVSDCAISPDGSRIVSTSYDKTVRVWDVQTATELAILQGHLDEVRCCAISPDQSFFATGGNPRLIIWDIETLQERPIITDHSGEIEDIAISTGSIFIVSASVDRSLKIWDPITGRRLSTLHGHAGEKIGGLTRGGQVRACAISPDLSYMVSAGTDRKIIKWDQPFRGGRVQYAQEALGYHEAAVNDCAISPDGRLIVSASSDKTLKVWDAETSRERFIMRGHTGEVKACAFTPDGRYILSASQNALKVWRAADGLELLTLPYWSANVYITLHPWLPVIVSGDQGGLMHIIDLVGIEYGPLIVTPVYHGKRFELRCPACGRVTLHNRDWLGAETTCPNPECALAWRVNPFVVGEPQKKGWQFWKK